MTERPDLVDRLRRFDGHLDPHDQAEDIRRANAMKADAKFMFLMVFAAFACGTLFGMGMARL
jgi:hypothetical protein